MLFTVIVIGVVIYLVGTGTDPRYVAVGGALGVAWGLVSLVTGELRGRRTEHRRQVERQRSQARYLADQRLDTVKPWRITSPTDPVLRDPARNAAWDETLRRRAAGEFVE